MVAPRRVNGFFAIQSVALDAVTLQSQIKTGEEVIQIIFDQNLRHYITAHLTYKNDVPWLKVYDPLLNGISMKNRKLEEAVTSSVVRQILDLFGHLDFKTGLEKEIPIEYEHNIDPQMDGWSCGYRAIGVILDMLQGLDPAMSEYDIRAIYALYQWMNRCGPQPWEEIIAFPYRKDRSGDYAAMLFDCVTSYTIFNEALYETIREEEIEAEKRAFKEKINQKFEYTSTSFVFKFKESIDGLCTGTAVTEPYRCHKFLTSSNSSSVGSDKAEVWSSWSTGSPRVSSWSSESSIDFEPLFDDDLIGKEPCRRGSDRLGASRHNREGNEGRGMGRERRRGFSDSEPRNFTATTTASSPRKSLSNVQFQDDSSQLPPEVPTQRRISRKSSLESVATDSTNEQPVQPHIFTQSPIGLKYSIQPIQFSSPPFSDSANNRFVRGRNGDEGKMIHSTEFTEIPLFITSPQHHLLATNPISDQSRITTTTNTKYCTKQS